MHSALMAIHITVRSYSSQESRLKLLWKHNVANNCKASAHNADVDISATLGESVRLPCQANDKITHIKHVTWYKDEGGSRKQIYSKRRDSMDEEIATAFQGRLVMGDHSRLKVSSTRLSDVGTYTCEVQGRARKKETSITLHLFAIPETPTITSGKVPVNVDAKPQPVLIGECTIKGSYPMSNLTWYKDSMELDNNVPDVKVDKKEVRESNGLYTISSKLHYQPTADDQDAKYHCDVVFLKNHGEFGRKKSSDISVEFIYAAENVALKIVSPSPQPIKEGDDVVLECSTEENADLDYTISWQKGGETNEHEGERLTLHSVTREDGVVYKCTTFDFLESVDGPSHEMTLQVNSIENLTVTPGGRVVKLYGDSLTLECDSSSSQTPVYIWTKDNNKVGEGMVLTLHSINYNQSGTYHCEVTVPSVPGLEKEVKVDVQVEGKPEVFVKKTKSSAKGVNFECMAKGYPTPKISWNVEQLPKEEKKSDFEVVSSLALPQKDAPAHVTCTASNKFGQSSQDSSVPSTEESSVGIIIVICIVAIIILLFLIGLTYWLWKKKRICDSDRDEPSKTPTSQGVNSGHTRLPGEERVPLNDTPRV
uniref:Ig-like domain-containing protein n=1 Tax=Eptatretus burgeri TaxID=7764 RepID=A0A8C4Q2A3_EPTBU